SALASARGRARGRRPLLLASSSRPWGRAVRRGEGKGREGKGPGGALRTGGSVPPSPGALSARPARLQRGSAGRRLREPREGPAGPRGWLWRLFLKFISKDCCVLGRVFQRNAVGGGRHHPVKGFAAFYKCLCSQELIAAVVAERCC
uniref:Uncharacterized protein n=1 Tax=Anser cygnoides TaxID=8845 RepID=A0A8B9IHV0_ANSCY